MLAVASLGLMESISKVPGPARGAPNPQRDENPFVHRVPDDECVDQPEGELAVEPGVVQRQCPPL